MKDNVDHIKYMKQLSENKIDVLEEKNYHVYALWFKGDIVYIGQSTKVETRIESHKKTKKFDQYSYIECKNEHQMIGLESHLINELRPKYNKDLGAGYISLHNLRKIIRALGDGYTYNPCYYIKSIKKELQDSDMQLVNFNNIDYIPSLYLDETVQFLVSTIGSNRIKE